MYDDEWEPDKIIDSLASEQAIMDLTDEKLAEKILKESAAESAKAITHIAIRSRNEKLRFDAARYVIERVLGKTTEGGITKPEEFMQDFMEEITVAEYSLSEDSDG